MLWSKCPDQFFWRVGIHRFHHDTSIFQCSFSRSRLEASTKEITPIGACSTFSAAQAVQHSPPAAKACFQSQFCTTVPLKYMNSIGSATLVAAMYQKCILQLYTDDTHVSGVPVLVSTTDGSKCHCSSGFNVSWQGFGRCIAGLGLNKHSSKAWFCVQAFAKWVALILTYSRDSLKCKLMLWNTLASGFLEAMPQALAPRPFCQAAPCHSIPEGPRTCTDSVQCLHGS